ncbi:MAG: hypothetical protein KDA91_04590 [Planctomycetaceae bacterium]|nr:hypothetical protein [Planctomycetaceae bacterium]
MSNPEHEAEITRQLEELQDQAGALIKPCRFASSSRLYGELRRKSRSEQRAYHYVMGTFFQMDQAQYLLDFQLMRERAIELIALLEDEERIRQIQADFPIEQYENLVYSMSSCAYENLAEATGHLEGYNSQGMHACIADGIQICRRTGKLGCIGCFREYACDVYLAADDAEIAMHQCRQVTEHEGAWSDRGDRRWVASGKAAWLDALYGRFDESIAQYEQALEFAQSELVSLKTEARIRTLLELDNVLIAAGREPVLEKDSVFSEMPSADECPFFEHSMDLNRALAAVQRHEWSTATEILTRWDQRLQKSGGTHLWFETRLRLVAAKRLEGQQKQAEALARQLEQRARVANDWLTIRRLDVLMSSSKPSPIAILVDLEKQIAEASDATGTQAPKISETPSESIKNDGFGESEGAAVDLESGDETSHEAGDTENATPLAAELTKLREQMNGLMSDPTEESFQAIRDEVLGYTTTQATHYDDVAGLIHIMGWLVGSASDGDEIWRWANSIAAPHRDRGIVLSVLGALGDALRNSSNKSMAEKITAERTEQLHLKALALDGNRARNHMRAGDHYLRENNSGEAERCFARAFRLDRTLPDVVERLADLYTETDRPRDALHVLDLSLREGADDYRIAFNAAMLSFRLQQFDSTLTYLDRFETLGGENRAWVCYYRAVCQYELQRYEESLMLLDLAEEAAHGTGWHLEVMRAVTLVQMDRIERAKPHINFVMQTPLHQVDFLSGNGIASLFERLLDVATNVLRDADLQNRIEERLLRSALMPDWWFQPLREDTPQQEGVHLYRCLLYQPVDDQWNSDHDRLDAEADWTAYGIEWGILATSEDEAVETALRWQSRCHSLPAQVEETLISNESYTDSPGAVWQSARFPISDDDDDLELDDSDFDDLDDDNMDDSDEFDDLDSDEDDEFHPGH